MPGIIALVELEKRLPVFTLITQNVDGLHQRAGSGVRFPVIELHGNIQRTKCFDEDQIVDTWEETGEIPPRCPRCAGLLRPDVVWFGELLPAEALERRLRRAAGCDLFLSVGTSGSGRAGCLAPLPCAWPRISRWSRSIPIPPRFPAWRPLCCPVLPGRSYRRWSRLSGQRFADTGLNDCQGCRAHSLSSQHSECRHRSR